MFELIRGAEGSDAYVCLHSLGLARHRRKDYAEADLITVGPAGVFCLEVKGGHVSRRAGVWTIGWPGKTYDSKEGPFAQAEGTRWALLDYLKKNVDTNIRNEIVLGWGVAFPDIIFDEKDPSWDDDVVYDQRDKAASFVTYVERLESYFRQRLADTGKRQPPRLSPGRVREIVESLRGDFEIIPTIRGLLAESRRELVRLSAEQYRILDFALNDGNPKIVCDGGAGTGKTLIAMEAARRLSSRGEKILLLCFNDNLQRFLRADAAELCGHVRVSTLYRFLGDVIRKGGLALQLKSAHSTSSKDQLFERVYPELFERAASALIEEDELPQFGAIIVDEAQDVLNGPMMNCLDLVLDRGFSGGRWLIFMDSGLQSDLYGRVDERVLAHLKSLKPAVFSLSDNFRNPKPIVREMCALTRIKEPVCRRELASRVEYRRYVDDRDQGRKLRAILVELLKEGVTPGDITILSAQNRNDACVTRFAPDIGKEICFLEPGSAAPNREAISASTISGFKGLENEIVILTDLPAVSNLGSWERSVLYIGMTRTRSKLFALVDEAFVHERAEC